MIGLVHDALAGIRIQVQVVEAGAIIVLELLVILDGREFVDRDADGGCQPALKSVMIHMWENTREFVRKAGTTILGASAVMWLLINLPWGVTEQREPYFGKFSGAIAAFLVYQVGTLLGLG